LPEQCTLRIVPEPAHRGREPPGLSGKPGGAHRPLPADSKPAQANMALVRAQQGAVWSRQQVGNQMRSLLREY
jgi:hypothetical protein